MTNKTIENLRNQIEVKENKEHKLRRDLRELEEDLKNKVERIGRQKGGNKNNGSILLEEIEYDIYLTELGIKKTSEHINKLEERLYEVTLTQLAPTVANE